MVCGANPASAGGGATVTDTERGRLRELQDRLASISELQSEIFHRRLGTSQMAIRLSWERAYVLAELEKVEDEGK